MLRKFKILMWSILPDSLVALIFRYKFFWGAQWAKKSNVGQGGYISPSVQVLGWRNVKIGKQTFIGEDTIIIVNCRQEDAVSIIVGDNCLIGRRNYISSGGSVLIGDYCMTAPDCRFLGGGHVYLSPFVPYISTGTQKDRRIKVGANCWFGVGAIILDGIEIGHGCVIGAGTLVNQNIPPFSIVVGNPCRIIKRFEMLSQTWVKAENYSDDASRFLPTEDDYLKVLRQKYPLIGQKFHICSNKFGDLL